MSGQKKLADTLIIPGLTTVATMIGMYGTYSSDKRDYVMTLGSIEVSPWLPLGVASGLTSFVVESLTNYGLDSITYDKNADITQKAKMAIEPISVGIVNVLATKMTDIPKVSAIGPFAIGASANILSAYGNNAVYAKKY